MPSSSRLPAQRQRPIEFTFDGHVIGAFEGETLATALLAAQVGAFVLTRDGDPRLPLCNMGSCFDCVVTVDGTPWTRACLTPARQGMSVSHTELF
ncbi:MAG: (2Fe-2S)-binding protein [Ornithinimicrobium sp.]|uniref:(2Fe-2S)-binding protein n=1 Tax=Ornithinimicrobium sp. TaxID=1977084 RepID=UPI0026E0365E|nr:(2Fe-2S)-binding protein [Ornithinimicrobium sp.]MDO5739766.1 (2Fe-2S)-binding protein [Ornithinimicrobium sp.]